MHLRPTLYALALTPLLACAPPTGGSSRGDDPADDDERDEEPTPEEAVNPFGDAGSCPTFQTGTVSFEAAGIGRSLEVELPDDPEGAPVVVAWHWLNGTATQTLDWMGIRELADAGYVVVAPESTGLPVEWDVADPSDDNVDLALFDALLPCLWDQFEVDADRVYATGMSAGGLMTTFLTMHRADTLAATAPFSGGAFSRDYRTPAEAIPVLVTWGGPEDTYGGYDFDAASREFLALLEDDGHFTVGCEHSTGHLPPSEAVDMLELFFGDHAKSAQSPWEGGLPGGLPGWCR